MNTTKMSSSIRFAVCYAENTGDATDSWKDTGIRLFVSKIVIDYGTRSTSFPVREWHSPNVLPAINRMPQVAGVVVS